MEKIIFNSNKMLFKTRNSLTILILFLFMIPLCSQGKILEEPDGLTFVEDGFYAKMYNTNTGYRYWQEEKRKIKGQVISEDSEMPLVGASVWVKETTNGTTTTEGGKFVLDVEKDIPIILVISFLGYEQKQMVIQPDQNDFLIKLEKGESALDSIQIVGYGTQRKESVIGAITTINPNKLDLPSGNISTNLAGQLAGIVSVDRGFEPGNSAEFWIRGISTFGANRTPLILVDGVERSIDLIDPQEIESFSILKDATATALYGVRGANGVVLIKTKRGSEGAPKISLRAEAGRLQPTKVPEMADAVEYATLYNEMKGYDYYTQEEIQKYRDGSDPDLYPNVDWVNTVFKRYTMNQKFTASVTGGGEIARYFIFGGYYHEDGIFNSGGDSYNGNPTFRRYNFRSNVDVNVSTSTVLSLTLGGYLTQRRSPSDGGEIWEKMFTLIPHAFPVRYSNGFYAGLRGASNPYYKVTRNGYSDSWQSTLNTIVSLKQDLSSVTRGLEAKIKFSFDAESSHTNTFTQQDDIWHATGRDQDGNLIFVNTPEESKGGPWFSSSSGGTSSTYLEGSITYDRLFGKHRVGGLLLYNQGVRNNVAGSAINSLPYKHQGLAGRATYNYDSRYFIEGNFGYNGSENFAPGHRVGFFPSLALGWYISHEDFFRPMKDFITKLKVKGSIGQVGNDQIGGGRRFVYLGTVANTGNYIYGDYYYKSGEEPDEIPNNQIGWEIATKRNLGVELGIRGKWDIEMDWFHNMRDKILVRNNNIPAYAGLRTTPLVNIGKMKSWGFDGSAEYHNQFGEVFISGRGTFTFATNRIIRDGNPFQQYPYRSTVGQRLFQYFGYQAIGLFESYKEIEDSPIQFSESIHSTLRPGDIKYQDINGDGKIDDLDQIPIGTVDVPEITYGAGGTIGWKGIELSLFFEGVGKVSAQLSGTSVHPFSNPYANLDNFNKDVVNNHWSVDNPDPNAKYPRLNDVNISENNNAKASSFWTRDASFIRLKSAEIGYTLPKIWVEKLQLRSLRVYLSGLNLITWASELKLYDPALGTTDGRRYPPSRIINAGIDINF